MRKYIISAAALVSSLFATLSDAQCSITHDLGDTSFSSVTADVWTTLGFQIGGFGPFQYQWQVESIHFPGQYMTIPTSYQLGTYHWAAAPWSTDNITFDYDGFSTSSPSLRIKNVKLGDGVDSLHIRCHVYGFCYLDTRVAKVMPCKADLDGSTLVDDSDFTIFLVAYDKELCGDKCIADLNKDGVVDDGDFTEFVIAYDVLLCS